MEPRKRKRNSHKHEKKKSKHIHTYAPHVDQVLGEKEKEEKVAGEKKGRCSLFFLSSERRNTRQQAGRRIPFRHSYTHTYTTYNSHSHRGQRLTPQGKRKKARNILQEREEKRRAVRNQKGIRASTFRATKKTTKLLL